MKTNKKGQTTKLILKTAEILFKTKGIEASGIKKIMNEIGLTVGGFYAHFKSKDELIKKSLNKSLNKMLEKYLTESSSFEGSERISFILQNYLSDEHRRDREEGCPIAAMASDISRCGPEVRSEVQTFFEDFYENIKKDLTGPQVDHIEGEKKRLEFYVYLSLAIGAMVMSRILVDEKLSHDLLQAARKKIKKELESYGIIS